MLRRSQIVLIMLRYTGSFRSDELSWVCQSLRSHVIDPLKQAQQLFTTKAQEVQIWGLQCLPLGSSHFFQAQQVTRSMTMKPCRGCSFRRWDFPSLGDWEMCVVSRGRYRAEAVQLAYSWHTVFERDTDEIWESTFQSQHMSTYVNICQMWRS